jgi:salicylate hydroxylase
MRRLKSAVLGAPRRRGEGFGLEVSELGGEDLRLDPLRHWSRGPVTLLGDSAHPMFPFFAQGAAQSIEDAAVLARCLAEETKARTRALRRYESIRIGRTTRLQQISHARAHVNHLPDGPEQAARDRTLAAADPLAAGAWIYAYDPDTADADAAG